MILFSSSLSRYLRNLVVEYVVNTAEERIHAGPTKCLLFAKVDIKEGADYEIIAGAAFATIDALVEKAADADDGDASVAIEEYAGESTKDICSDVPVERKIKGCCDKRFIM